jgi:hypothetical protein
VTRPHPYPPSTSRVVGYRWEAAAPLPDLRAVDRILDAAVVAGVVTQWDRDRNDCFVWLNGTPGPALREVRRRVAALIGEPTG